MTKLDIEPKLRFLWRSNFLRDHAGLIAQLFSELESELPAASVCPWLVAVESEQSHTDQLLLFLCAIPTLFPGSFIFCPPRETATAWERSWCQRMRWALDQLGTRIDRSHAVLTVCKIGNRCTKITIHFRLYSLHNKTSRQVSTSGATCLLGLMGGLCWWWLPELSSLSFLKDITAAQNV